MPGVDEPPPGEGYAVEPSDEPPPRPAITEVVEAGIGCRRCGYELRGLPAGGRCPECGTLVARSLHGDLLRYSDERYLAALHRGVVLILAAVAAQLVLAVLSIVAGISMAWAPAAAASLPLLASFAATTVSLVLLLGWWLFSAPDPAFAGTDRGTTARGVVRATVAAEALLAAVGAAADAWSTTAIGRPMGAMVMAVGAAQLMASAVRFFASMLYLRWLAPRLPNAQVDARAKRLMWLGPVLYTVGALVCIGPLIAVVLYWNMLNWVRLDLLRIRAEQA